MPENWDLVLSIVSDLHCHEASHTPQESWLVAGSLRKPAGHHPVQALLALIQKHSLTSDVVICPGDLSNKISQAGMAASWQHLGEIQLEMKAIKLITTIGNHDVDWGKKRFKDPFHIPRNLHDKFPTDSDELCASFWSDGFYLAPGPKGSVFLVLNTVVSHTDESSAKQGTFEHERIDKLDRTLGNFFSNGSHSESAYKRVVVMHHHPLLHSATRFSSSDVLEFGDQLIRVLVKHGFHFIVHGHRHDPRITRLSTSPADSFVFASGSFAAVLNELSTWTRNLFHIAKLRYETANNRFVGQILTWEFNKGTGWVPSTSSSAALPHIIHFCSPRPTINSSSILDRCRKELGGVLKAKRIQEFFPELSLLLPSELEAIQAHLKDSGVKFLFSSEGTLEQIGIP